MKRKRKLAKLEAWYDQEYSHLYNYIAYRVTDSMAAEEIVATVCERALKRLHQFDPGRGSFTAWMFGIARNTLNDHYRTDARRRNEISLESLPPIRGRGHTPEEQAVKAERFRQVILLLDHLPEDKREVLALRYGSELTYREIAEVMEISTDHVGVLLHRALGKLRDALNKNEKETEHETREL